MANNRSCIIRIVHVSPESWFLFCIVRFGLGRWNTEPQVGSGDPGVIERKKNPNFQKGGGKPPKNISPSLCYVHFDHCCSFSFCLLRSVPSLFCLLLRSVFFSWVGPFLPNQKAFPLCLIFQFCRVVTWSPQNCFLFNFCPHPTDFCPLFSLLSYTWGAASFVLFE